MAVEIDALPLGGKPPVRDPRQFRAAAVIDAGFDPPDEIDLELTVGNPPPPEPMRSTGLLANQYAGCCTFSAMDGLLTRYQRREHPRATYERMDPDVLVREYLDANGNDLLGGWYGLDALQRWRKQGLPTRKGRRRIDWFGSVNPHDEREIRTCLTVFGGLYVVAGLPMHWQSALAQASREGRPAVLDVGSTPIASWGWHAVFTNAASVAAGGLWLSFESWGMGRHLVPWRSVSAYITELFAVADGHDHVRYLNTIRKDVVADQFAEIGKPVPPSFEGA